LLKDVFYMWQYSWAAVWFLIGWLLVAAKDSGANKSFRPIGKLHTLRVGIVCRACQWLGCCKQFRSGFVTIDLMTTTRLQALTAHVLNFLSSLILRCMLELLWLRRLPGRLDDLVGRSCSGRLRNFVAMDKKAYLVHSDVCHHVLSLAKAISEIKKRFLMYIKLSM
jgi:hypothetical protein